MGAMVGLRLAGQRPAAEERRRAADRPRLRRRDRRSTISRRRARRPIVRPRRTLPARDGRRRRAGRVRERAGRADGRRQMFDRMVKQRESFWSIVYSAVHGPRSDAQRSARDHHPRAAGDRRQLQDAGRAVQHGADRLQAVPELPAQAGMPGARSRISAPSAPGTAMCRTAVPAFALDRQHSASTLRPATEPRPVCDQGRTRVGPSIHSHRQVRAAILRHRRFRIRCRVRWSGCACRAA